MALILCIETATETCSVALSKDGECASELILDTAQLHSKMLTSLIRQLMFKNQIELTELSAIALGDGPGSYTGLRVGASTVKAICFALDIPMIAISSLQGLADPFRSKQYDMILSTIDARRMESYGARFNSKLEEIEPSHSFIWTQTYIDNLTEEFLSPVICGTGIEKAMNTFYFPKDIILHPSNCLASNICGLAFERFSSGQTNDIAYHSPNYLKMPNITKPKGMGRK